MTRSHGASPSLDSTKVIVHLSDRSMVVVVETTMEGGAVGASFAGWRETLVGDAGGGGISQRQRRRNG